MKNIRGYCLMLILGMAMALGGCAAKQVPQFSPEDNPEHHYLRGMEALESENISDAQNKFERAVYRNEKYALGYAGLAIVAAQKAKAQTDNGLKKVESERAAAHLKKARKYADTPEEKYGCDLAAIRVAAILKEKGWLDKAEDAYHDAMSLKINEQKLLYYQGKEAASYFMGVAFLEAQEFQQARDRFGDVLNAKREGKWHEPSDRAWKKADKIVRALAGITVGEVAKKLAMKGAISRGDMAALLIDELKMDKLMAGRIPIRSEIEKNVAEFVPADIRENPFKEEITVLMKWKVRGMEPRYDKSAMAYLFQPADDVQRGELALILEDVLVKLTGDEKISSAYFNHEKSPFPDVRPTSPIYNAVMNMTTRGIMVGEYSGEFRPNQPVDGAEALLAIRVLKQRINIY